MSASENSGRNSYTWTGPYAVPDHPDLADVHVLPAPYAEKALAAVEVARGTVRAHRAAAGGVAAGAAAGRVLAFALGRRAGRGSGRGGLGPMALFVASHI
ncbi:hypothetical protein ACFV2S_05275 [Streptomyces sp. NPDC059695]|uniref:hypothetical protein n=1 Tax=Streptomyces sp. NPDC059695 TaxID=3346910 RepID=UPI0036CF6D6B